jgi:hypothetical protein
MGALSERGMLVEVDPFRRRLLMHGLAAFVEHFRAERNHQGKGSVLLFPSQGLTAGY